jgi:hypothetical protein
VLSPPVPPVGVAVPGPRADPPAPALVLVALVLLPGPSAAALLVPLVLVWSLFRSHAVKVAAMAKRTGT